MGQLRVLVVDDHRLVRDALCTALRSRGVTVVGSCSSGEQGWTAADALQPDAVLMDLVMPGMGGVEATKRIKQRHPEVRIVALTARPLGRAAGEAVQAGATCVLSKDTGIAQIVSALSAQSGCGPAAP